jgi:hypothetical protein
MSCSSRRSCRLHRLPALGLGAQGPVKDYGVAKPQVSRLCRVRVGGKYLHHVFHGCRDQWFCGGLCPVVCVPVRMPWSGVALGFDSPEVFCCILLKLRYLMCWFPSGPAGASPVAVTGSCRWVAPPGKRGRPAPPAVPLWGPRRVASVGPRPLRQLRPSAWIEQMTVTVPSSGAAPSHPPGVEMAGGRDGQPDSMRGTRTQVGPGHLCSPPMRAS